jgi:XTP/dITP diphosphohydrolase
VRRAVLASGNPGKLRELAALLAPLSLELVAQSTLGIAAVAESGSTFEENARIKALHAARNASLPALADDSGLEVDALGGRPGVWSARFAGAAANDDDNLRRLLSELAGIPAAQRAARYRCVVVFARGPQDETPLIARGSWEGHIALEPRGTAGFGYDPAFVPAGGERTAAQLSASEKNTVSHRAQALNSLVAMLATEGYIRAP